MHDLIERQAAIDVLDRNHILGQGLLNDTLDHIADAIMALPSAQPDSKELSFTHKALDTISRQAAIDALEKVAELFPWRVPGNRDSYDRYNEAWNDAIGRAEIEIEELPSAQPETHEERTETHACDCISRKEAIDAHYEYCNKHPDAGFPVWSLKILEDLPSAQSEHIKQTLDEVYAHAETEAEARFHDEIVRCKDCNHWSRESICDGFCAEDCMRHDEDFYCGYAERRTDSDGRNQMADTSGPS